MYSGEFFNSVLQEASGRWDRAVSCKSPRSAISSPQGTTGWGWLSQKLPRCGYLSSRSYTSLDFSSPPMPRVCWPRWRLSTVTDCAVGMSSNEGHTAHELSANVVSLTLQVFWYHKLNCSFASDPPPEPNQCRSPNFLLGPPKWGWEERQGRSPSGSRCASLVACGKDWGREPRPPLCLGRHCPAPLRCPLYPGCGSTPSNAMLRINRSMVQPEQNLKIPSLKK